MREKGVFSPSLWWVCFRSFSASTSSVPHTASDNSWAVKSCTMQLGIISPMPRRICSACALASLSRKSMAMSTYSLRLSKSTERLAPFGTRATSLPSTVTTVHRHSSRDHSEAVAVLRSDSMTLTKGWSMVLRSRTSTLSPATCFQKNGARLSSRGWLVRRATPKSTPTNLNIWRWRDDCAAALSTRVSRLNPWSALPLGARIKRGVAPLIRSRQHSLMVSLYGPPASCAPSPSRSTCQMCSSRRRAETGTFWRSVKSWPNTDRKPSSRQYPFFSAHSAAAIARPRDMVTLLCFPPLVSGIAACNNRSFSSGKIRSRTDRSSLVGGSHASFFTRRNGIHRVRMVLRVLRTTNLARRCGAGRSDSLVIRARRLSVRESPTVSLTVPAGFAGAASPPATSATPSASTARSSNASRAMDWALSCDVFLPAALARSAAIARSCVSASLVQN
mmetsp:Transcript_5464/g.12956  ORF Transcript_5464/g.12956 Transcript_5464/m.12956 type:complete len:447 (-) Transcript_5464:349-1689(-)